MMAGEIKLGGSFGDSPTVAIVALTIIVALRG
jgi:hypothetical protein